MRGKNQLRTCACLVLVVAACSDSTEAPLDSYVDPTPDGGTVDASPDGGTNVIDPSPDGGIVVDASSPRATRSIGGTVAGLVGLVELEESTAASTVRISADGAFVFPTRVADAASYAVAVRAQPVGQTCVVVNGGGVVNGGDVTNVTVTCGHELYSVGGTISGLVGSIVMTNNGGDVLTRTTNGAFSFGAALPTGTPYAVAVAKQPGGQYCSVTNAAGTVTTGSIDDVTVICKPAQTVGGTVSGLLGGAVALQLNGATGDGIAFVDDNGVFTFERRVPSSDTYAVTVLRSPPGQTCSVTSNGSGTVGASNVTNVVVTCRKLAVALDEVNARVATGVYGDANGDGIRDGGDEFVELVNGESFPVDIGGWVLRTGTTLTTRFTFPPGTTLPAGARAVVFGGGTPTGSFGGAATFTAALGLTDAPATPFTVDVAATNGFRVDSFEYDATTFPACTTACASMARSPAVTGAFAPHTTLSGSGGILWSPGVTPAAAIPKLAGAFSLPRPAATLVGIDAPIRVQLNMFMNVADFAEPQLRLFASSCGAPKNQVTSFTTFGVDTNASQARLVPSSPLAFDTTYCVSLAPTMRSANDTPLAAPATYEFTTRAAASVTATSVVISEVGGCRFSSSSGTTGCGGTGLNDEFVELYNPTAAPISVAGFHIQRRSATGGATCWATLPGDASVAPFSYYLVGGAGYTAARYAGAPVADYLETTNGTALTGANESVVLLSSTATNCTTATTSSVVDAVSVGTITTDVLTPLPLPALETTIANGRSIERKACYDSVAGAGGTGMQGGGHGAAGNGERIGSTFSDFVTRTAPGPQNSASTSETRTCL